MKKKLFETNTTGERLTANGEARCVKREAGCVKREAFRFTAYCYCLLILLMGPGEGLFAQDKTICQNISYTIPSVEPATGASTYQWLENGVVLSGETAATCLVPANHALGTYVYVRRAYVQSCGAWLSSNGYMLAVTGNPAITRSAGEASPTVYRGSPLTPVVYTATNAADISWSWSGTAPAGVNLSKSGLEYTLSGTPSITGTFGYTVSVTNDKGCNNPTPLSGTITVSLAPPPLAASTQTWRFGSSTLTWSDAIKSTADCDKNEYTNSTSTSYCRSYQESSEASKRYYYNWTYVNKKGSTLCPGPTWRIPTKNDFDEFVKALGEDVQPIIAAWGFGGYAYNSLMIVTTLSGYYWSSTAVNSNAYFWHYFGSSQLVGDDSKSYGFQVRCVN
jgi:hypothetical protein